MGRQTDIAKIVRESVGFICLVYLDEFGDYQVF